MTVYKKRAKLAVKVMDIFGNDTTTIVDVSLRGGSPRRTGGGHWEFRVELRMKGGAK